jgi:hypothetical protein
MNVRFFAGSKKQYLGLTKYDPLALYFCYDTRELFWGDLLLSDGMRVVATFADLPSFDTAADGIVYFVTETRNGYTLSNSRTEWIQVIQASEGGNGQSVDLSDYFTKSEITTAIKEAVNGLVTEEYVNNKVAGVNTTINNISQQVTNIENNYVTTDVLEENYTTTVQLKAKIDEAIQDKVDSGEIAVKADAISYDTW